MRREYDLFEITNGRPTWRGHVIGTLEAGAMLRELGRKTHHECFLAQFPSREVVARVNLGSPASHKPEVFQIIYDYTQAIERVQLLRLHGCDVAFAIGSDAAKTILGTPQRWDLFTVGYAAPRETVRDMVEWLKAHYPGVPILELTSRYAPRSSTVNRSSSANVVVPWISAIANALSAACQLEPPGAPLSSPEPPQPSSPRRPADSPRSQNAARVKP